MMNHPDESFKKVLSTQYFAVLNTQGEGIPYSNLVSFATSADLKSLLFVTSRNTRKFRNIIENPRVSLLIDNRTNQPSDISLASAITVLGTAHENTENRNDLRDIFIARHPQLQQFVDTPGNALILVTVSDYILADFENTYRIVLS